MAIVYGEKVSATLVGIAVGAAIGGVTGSIFGGLIGLAFDNQDR